MSDDIGAKVVGYIQDAHAMEGNVLVMLESMIASTQDDAMRQRLEQHRDETRGQQQLLEQRLQSLGVDTSVVKDVPAILGALGKGLVDAVRGDKPGKNVRDGYVTEHLEIAAYQLLERLARSAGDEETAAVARRIRAEEEEMARFFDANWDKAIELTLQESGTTSS